MGSFSEIVAPLIEQADAMVAEAQARADLLQQQLDSRHAEYLEAAKPLLAFLGLVEPEPDAPAASDDDDDDDDINWSEGVPVAFCEIMYDGEPIDEYRVERFGKGFYQLVHAVCVGPASNPQWEVHECADCSEPLTIKAIHEAAIHLPKGVATKLVRDYRRREAEEAAAADTAVTASAANDDADVVTPPVTLIVEPTVAPDPVEAEPIAYVSNLDDFCYDALDYEVSAALTVEWQKLSDIYRAVENLTTRGTVYNRMRKLAARAATLVERRDKPTEAYRLKSPAPAPNHDKSVRTDNPTVESAPVVSKPPAPPAAPNAYEFSIDTDAVDAAILAALTTNWQTAPEIAERAGNLRLSAAHAGLRRIAETYRDLVEANATGRISWRVKAMPAAPEPDAPATDKTDAATPTAPSEEFSMSVAEVEEAMVTIGTRYDRQRYPLAETQWELEARHSKTIAHGFRAVSHLWIKDGNGGEVSSRAYIPIRKKARPPREGGHFEQTGDAVFERTGFDERDGRLYGPTALGFAIAWLTYVNGNTCTNVHPTLRERINKALLGGQAPRGPAALPYDGNYKGDVAYAIETKRGEKIAEYVLSKRHDDWFCLVTIQCRNGKYERGFYDHWHHEKRYGTFGMTRLTDDVIAALKENYTARTGRIWE